MTSKLGEVCTASEPEMCYTDDECAVQHPCTRTECSTKSIHLRTITGLKGRGAKGPEQGVCVCFGGASRRAVSGAFSFSKRIFSGASDIRGLVA
jgi:hypothetical protein